MEERKWILLVLMWRGMKRGEGVGEDIDCCAVVDLLHPPMKMSVLIDIPLIGFYGYIGYISGYF